MSNPKILDHLDHPSFLEIATYGDHDGGDTDSITVECTKCGEVVHTLWERGAENDYPTWLDPTLSDHHERCAQHVDSRLRCTCEHERDWDNERRKEAK